MTHKAESDFWREAAGVELHSRTRRNDAQAEKYLRMLFAAFARIAQNPNLGRRRADIPEPYLVHGVGSHLIVYRYNQPHRRVEILNILHPAMNLAQRLQEARHWVPPT